MQPAHSKPGILTTVIAQKYKKYQRVRDILDGKTVPPPKENQKPMKPVKRKSAHESAETPQKRQRHAETPSKNRRQDVEALQQTPGTSRKLFSPPSVTSLGPTPQRDGRVLGLFDLLVEKELGTPSKKDRNAAVNATPSKRNTASLDAEGTPRLTRTPMSASKRHMLNTFMTPLKNRDGNAVAKTPSSTVSKLQFDTPQFLKRHTMPTVDENGEYNAPAPLRLPRKPLGRGLSEIVATLRKVEEEYHNDDEEALREMECEEMGLPKPAPKPVVTAQAILEKDSQPGQLPLGGFDDEGILDSDQEGDKDRNGNPMRLFKKKGQKRTTRRVNMRPNWVKRPEDMPQAHASDDEGDTIPETQADTAAGHNSDAEYQNKDADAKKQKKKRPAQEKAGDGPIKKAARKVNELAHANFRRLKVRNYGAKGGPGFNSRFRRKR